MSALRQDRTTGAWVIIAPDRGRRPREWRTTHLPASEENGLASRVTCPFCPGHETMLPDIIEETAQNTAPGWRVRIVPNRYPLVSNAGGSPPLGDGVHQIMAGAGRHEVIIDNPRHDADLAFLPNDEIAAVIGAYHRRYVAMTSRRDIKHVVVFRNRGASAGASLHHPHSQIVGLTVVPPKATAIAAWAAAQYRKTGGCVTCDEIAIERRDGARLVGESDSFISLVPFAATGPFELWLLPKRHTSSFGASAPDELDDLARLLGRSLRRIDATIGAVPYNFVIESWEGRRFAPSLHWRLRIVPDVTTPAGFELGTGFSINPSLPEEDARALRADSVVRPDPRPG